MCVESTSPGNKPTFGTWGGVNNLISAAEGSLIYSADELNKAWFKYEIKCDGNVADAQIDEILNLSKVTDVDTGKIPTVSKLKETQNTEPPIKIGNAAAFFRPSNSESKSKLALFKLKSDVKDVEGEVLKKAIYSINSFDKYFVKYCTIADEIYAEYLNKGEYFLENTSWSKFTNEHVQEWQESAEQAINIAKACYEINKDSAVGAFLYGGTISSITIRNVPYTNYVVKGATQFYKEFTSKTSIKDKMVYLQCANNRALTACGLSLELRGKNLKGYTENTFIASDKSESGHKYNYRTLKQNCICGLQNRTWDSVMKYQEDIGGIKYICEKANEFQLFNDSNSTLYEEALLLNTSQEYVTSETNEEIQTSNMFQIYNTSERYAKLYFKNNVITFEIPINLPEYKELTKKMSSFKISTEEINPILTQ